MKVKKIKFKKAKLFRLLAMSGTLAAIVATPIIVTSCGTNSSSNNGAGGGDNSGTGGSGGGSGSGGTSQTAVKPVFKNSITGSGELQSLLTSDATATRLQNNINKIVENDKAAVISNWSDIKTPEEQAKVNVTVTAKDWTNDKWGTEEYSAWSKDLPSMNTKEWKGDKAASKPMETAVDKLKITTNKDLKTYFNKPETIKQIALNAGIIMDNDKDTKIATLADSNLGFGIDGSLLIGIVVNDNTPAGPVGEASKEKMKVALNKEIAQETKMATKYVLKVPSDSIDFAPTLSFSGTYGNNQQIEPVDTSLTYTIKTLETQEKTFVMGSQKSSITLSDKAISEKDQIGLWTNVDDEGILKALGWLEASGSLTNKDSKHNDGEPIDSTLLNEKTIETDLGINPENETIFSVTVEMTTRDVNSDKYNGEYSLLVDVLEKNKTNDFGLNFKTYKIVTTPSTDKKAAFVPLQLKVPNAYIIDSELSTEANKKYDKVIDLTIGAASTEQQKASTNLLSEAFKLAGSGITGASTSDTNPYIQKNLENKTIMNSFQKSLVDQTTKSQGFSIINGLDLTFSSVEHRGNDVGQNNYISSYGKVVTFTYNLKKGFDWKKNNISKTISQQGKDSAHTKTFSLSNKNLAESKVSFGVNLAPAIDNTKPNNASVFNYYSNLTLDEYITELGGTPQK